MAEVKDDATLLAEDVLPSVIFKRKRGARQPKVRTTSVLQDGNPPSSDDTGGKIVTTQNKDAQVDNGIPEDIPFAYMICRKPYTNPVITRCGHCFCEKCALARFKTVPNCATCGLGTNGSFNSARKLKGLIDKIH